VMEIRLLMKMVVDSVGWKLELHLNEKAYS